MRFLLLLTVLLATAAVHAQPAVRTGTQVRVATADGRLIGVALDVGADTLVVADRVSGQPTPVFYGDMESLEVRRIRSRTRDVTRGALIGGGIGAVPSVAFLVADQLGGGGGYGLYGAVYFAPLIPVGAGIGAVLGAVGPTDWWERVPTGWVWTRQVALGADGGGVRLVVRM